MATLVSPGTSVTVVDESAYASPGTGTIPLIIITTREDKTDPTGTEIDGIAKYTKAENAGLVVPVTSQREISQFFGDAIFTEGEGQETSEYGLLAGYSYLGQGNQAYMVRADVNLSELEVNYDEPSGPLPLGTIWLDTDDSAYGIHKWDGSSWVRQTPFVEVVRDAASINMAGGYTPVASGVEGDYLVAILTNPTDGITLEYFVYATGVWVKLGGIPNVFFPHYDAPTTPAVGDTWIKTTSPGNGTNLLIYVADNDGVFQLFPFQGVENASGSGSYIAQDGTSTSVIQVADYKDNYLQLGRFTSGYEIKITGDTVPETLTGDAYPQDGEPVGAPEDGQLWYNDVRTELDILVRDSSGVWNRVPAAAITYDTTAPSTGLAAGDIWVDTTAVERDRPKIYQYDGSAWLLHDNTDQSTQSGVLFDDFTYISTTAGDITADLISSAPSPALYPAGMLAINMALSKNTVRKYDTSVGAWVNAATNNADGSGSFGRLAQRRVIANAMQAAVAGNEDLRDPMRNFTLLVAPNFPELADELITLNSDRGETGFIILDAPMRKTPTEAIQWVQAVGAAENGDDGLVSKNTYSAVYYPSGRSTTPSGETVTVPASHNVLYTYAYNDNIAYPWFAPAGLTRGIVQNGSAVGYITSEEEFKAIALNQGQRDAMYSNKLNPIATFPSEGVVVWGQKTLHPFSSALDRVNVARLVAYLRERFDVISRPFLFEPNDQPTRDRAKAVFDGFMEDILTKRGVTDFAVVCDESNNTPARIDRNELYIDIAIEPTKAAEFIYIPIRIVNTGTLSG